MSTEIEVPGSAQVPSRLEQVQVAERDLFAATVKYSMIAVPICVVIWLGLVSIALALAHSGNFFIALPMAGGVGVVAGLFFGAWAAFLAKAHALDELDRRVERP
ncbi:MAG TPA: hypothetical protein VLV81_04310 [Acidimicrobiia bacterium]|nr:hypothetical protein [Acidimicrobiia bacterium]